MLLPLSTVLSQRSLLHVVTAAEQTHTPAFRHNPHSVFTLTLLQLCNWLSELLDTTGKSLTVQLHGIVSTCHRCSDVRVLMWDADKFSVTFVPPDTDTGPEAPSGDLSDKLPVSLQLTTVPTPESKGDWILESSSTSFDISRTGETLGPLSNSVDRVAVATDRASQESPSGSDPPASGDKSDILGLIILALGASIDSWPTWLARRKPDTTDVGILTVSEHGTWLEDSELWDSPVLDVCHEVSTSCMWKSRWEVQENEEDIGTDLTSVSIWSPNTKLSLNPRWLQATGRSGTETEVWLSLSMQLATSSTSLYAPVTTVSHSDVSPIYSVSSSLSSALSHDGTTSVSPTFPSFSVPTVSEVPPHKPILETFPTSPLCESWVSRAMFPEDALA